MTNYLLLSGEYCTCITFDVVYINLLDLFIQMNGYKLDPGEGFCRTSKRFPGTQGFDVQLNTPDYANCNTV